MFSISDSFLLHYQIFSILKYFIVYSKDGYPNGSVVGFAPDEDGNPFFIFSGMSSHTQGEMEKLNVFDFKYILNFDTNMIF